MGAAAASPVPSSPPGVQQFVLTPPPARSLIDQQIMEVEERLDKRIAQLMMEMNGWSAQLDGRIDKLLGSATSATAPGEAISQPVPGAGAPPDAAATATSTAMPG